jgi:hypothetical protein
LFAVWALSFWGGVWGGFLEKMVSNREKTTPKPTPLFWRSACNHNSFGRFRTIAKTLSPAFHAGNRGSNPLGDANYFNKLRFIVIATCGVDGSTDGFFILEDPAQHIFVPLA